jgi:hypothetical protein
VASAFDRNVLHKVVGKGFDKPLLEIAERSLARNRQHRDRATAHPAQHWLREKIVSLF